MLRGFLLKLADCLDEGSGSGPGEAVRMRMRMRHQVLPTYGDRH
jgi:hypothetical protein